MSDAQEAPVHIRERTQIMIAELQAALESVNPDLFDELVTSVDAAKRVFLAGAGRSRLVMAMTAMRWMQMGLNVHLAGEVTAPACGTGDILLIGSGSGSTATLVPLASRATEAGTSVALITRAPSSLLAEQADVTVLLSLPLESDAPGGLKSTQPLGTLFEQALMFTGDLLTEALMQRRGISPLQMQSRHANLE